MNSKIIVYTGSKQSPNNLYIKQLNGPHISCNTMYYCKQNCSFTGSESPLGERLPTDFECRWLIECIKQNRFVPPNEIQTESVINNYEIF